MQHVKICLIIVLTLFQSMHPIKDATPITVELRVGTAISIHAPYKGCNVETKEYDCHISIFQSMHPIKDATMEIFMKIIAI